MNHDFVPCNIMMNVSLSQNALNLRQQLLTQSEPIEVNFPLHEKDEIFSYISDMWKCSKTNPQRKTFRCRLVNLHPGQKTKHHGTRPRKCAVQCQGRMVISRSLDKSTFIIHPHTCSQVFQKFPNVVTKFLDSYFMGLPSTNLPLHLKREVRKIARELVLSTFEKTTLLANQRQLTDHVKSRLLKATKARRNNTNRCSVEKAL
jgi:hypothetical protein